MATTYRIAFALALALFLTSPAVADGRFAGSVLVTQGDGTALGEVATGNLMQIFYPVPDEKGIVIWRERLGANGIGLVYLYWEHAIGAKEPGDGSTFLDLINATPIARDFLIRVMDVSGQPIGSIALTLAPYAVGAVDLMDLCH